jgi:hypothetical protein
MKTAIAIILCAITCGAKELPVAYVSKLADAIYRAEGGAKARKPYGILSVPVANHAEARRVCVTTIRNSYARWERAGRPGQFVDFIGNRYCPPSADPRGNVNWRRNVSAIMGERK